MIDFVVAHAPVIATLLFVTMFVCVATWTYWPKNKEVIESYGKIPLKESQDGE